MKKQATNNTCWLRSSPSSKGPPTAREERARRRSLQRERLRQASVDKKATGVIYEDHPDEGRELSQPVQVSNDNIVVSNRKTRGNGKARNKHHSGGITPPSPNSPERSDLPSRRSPRPKGGLPPNKNDLSPILAHQHKSRDGSALSDGTLRNPRLKVTSSTDTSTWQKINDNLHEKLKKIQQHGSCQEMVDVLDQTVYRELLSQFGVVEPSNNPHKPHRRPNRALTKLRADKRKCRKAMKAYKGLGLPADAPQAVYWMQVWRGLMKAHNKLRVALKKAEKKCQQANSEKRQNPWKFTENLFAQAQKPSPPSFSKEVYLPLPDMKRPAAPSVAFLSAQHQGDRGCSKEQTKRCSPWSQWCTIPAIQEMCSATVLRYGIQAKFLLRGQKHTSYSSQVRETR